MVRETDTVYRYTLATEAELDELLAGKMAGNGIPFSSFSELTSPQPGFIGVVSTHSPGADSLVRPLLLVSHEQDVRRLCGRYAQLRTDLSPLSAWCHLLTPKFFAPLETFVRHADLDDMEAAWVGLVVAETVLLVDRPLASVRISGCLATQSFAIARASALWRVSTEEVLRRFDAANQLCRNESAAQREESRAGKLRSSLRPLWATLSACTSSELVLRSEIAPTSLALRELAHARRDRLENEAFHVAKPLLDIAPEAAPFERLQELTPEMRLRLFDRLIEGLNAPGDKSSVRHHALALLAGYLATVAAGGAPSLALAETHAARWPEVTAWAYLTGGIGERVTWTSGFDGLGRLVARELLRPFRLDESPTCDFSFDEAAVLADASLADPLVHLRVKQARQVGVGLLPGVNVSIPILEPSASKQESSLADLKAGRLDAASIDPLVVVYAQKTDPALKDFGVSVIEQPTAKELAANPKLSAFNQYQVVWYCSKKAKELCAKLSGQIDDMYADGSSKSILTKWGVDADKFLQGTELMAKQRAGIDRPSDWVAPSLSK